MSRGFPSDFLWGAATSAFQIEGGFDSDGKGESIWDRFCARPDTIEDGSDGRVSCNHYLRWEEDVGLLDAIGLNAYRFSVSWPRVFPEGRGQPLDAGLSFYDRLVDRLLERGIEPMVTLYHWDLPQALETQGGWRVRATAEAFESYAEVVGRRLGDRVSRWITHNEPFCAAMLGHETGVHAPGLRDPSAALAAAHHILLSHGWATHALRAEAPQCKVGLAQPVSPGYPASSSEADIEATRIFDGAFNRWFIEAPSLGRYPADMIEHYIDRGYLVDSHPALARPADLDAISTPTDFLGINYYSRTIVRADVPEKENLPRELHRPDDEHLTDMEWEVYPQGLFEALDRARREWGAQELYVTEFGAAYAEGPGSDGEINDDRRVQFLSAHLEQAQQALQHGIPLKGMFVWSLLDNFEWAHGYSKRFGITWIDYRTGERTPKRSARWYGDYVRQAREEVSS